MAGAPAVVSAVGRGLKTPTVILREGLKPLAYIRSRARDVIPCRTLQGAVMNAIARGLA